jgi:hypothetical protein
MVGAVIAVSIFSVNQHCGYGYGYGGYNNTYQQYVYQGYVPSYSYNYVQPTYYHVPYVQKQVITKFVEVVPAASYSALGSEYVRAERKQEEVQGLREQLAELKGIVTTLSQVPQQPALAPTIVQQPAPQPAPVYAQAQSPQPQAQPIYPQPQTPAKGLYSVAPAAPVYPAKGIPSTQAPPPPLDPAGFSGADFSTAGLAVLNKCAQCHTAPNGKGGRVIFDRPGQMAALTPQQWQEIETQVVQGLMPPPETGIEVTTQETLALHDFIRAQLGGGNAPAPAPVTASVQPQSVNPF